MVRPDHRAAAQIETVADFHGRGADCLAIDARFHVAKDAIAQLDAAAGQRQLSVGAGRGMRPTNSDGTFPNARGNVRNGTPETPPGPPPAERSRPSKPARHGHDPTAAKQSRDSRRSRLPRGFAGHRRGSPPKAAGPAQARTHCPGRKTRLSARIGRWPFRTRSCGRSSWRDSGSGLTAVAGTTEVDGGWWTVDGEASPLSRVGDE